MQELDPAILKKANAWLEGSYDDDVKKEVQALLDNKAYTELTDSFYRDLEFGTGGLRGIMGAGSNRINKYTIGAISFVAVIFLRVMRCSKHYAAFAAQHAHRVRQLRRRP